MNLKAMRAAALKAAQDIINGAKALGRDLTAEEVTAVEAKHAEIADLDAKIKAAADQEQLIKSIGALGGTAEEQDEKPEESRAKSLGDHFVQHLKAAGKSLKSSGTIAAPEFKAATDTQTTGIRNLTGAFGPLITDIDREPVFPVRRRLVIADLLNSGGVSGNAITYPVYGALEGGTGAVAEGGQKPQLHLPDPTWATDALGEVAGWFKMTDDMAEDLDYVVSEINSAAIYDLQLKEENALLNGSGTAPNLRGILNRSGVQTITQTDQSTADTIHQAITKVETGSGFAADAIVINPLDYEALRLAKDGNDQYYGGGFFSGQYGTPGLDLKVPIWGLPTVVTSAIAQGTILVGAFGQAKVFRKGGLRVESTNSHEDDFTNDKITVRVRERLGLQVKFPAGFVKVTLTTPEA